MAARTAVLILDSSRSLKQPRFKGKRYFSAIDCASLIAQKALARNLGAAFTTAGVRPAADFKLRFFLQDLIRANEMVRPVTRRCVETVAALELGVRGIKSMDNHCRFTQLCARGVFRDQTFYDLFNR